MKKKKIDHISKTKNFTKKVIYAKNEPSLLNSRGAQTRYDVTWNITPIFIFRKLRIFYVKMATFEGGGLYILSWDSAKLIFHFAFTNQIMLYINVHKNVIENIHIFNIRNQNAFAKKKIVDILPANLFFHQKIIFHPIRIFFVHTPENMAQVTLPPPNLT